MAEKLIIDIYKNKNPEELTKLLAEKDSRLEAGSAAAMTAASAAALFARAAAFTAEEIKNDARLDYIIRNSEIIRSYMVYLIDEDVKSRYPLRKALKEGKAQEIEAARQPAVCIAGEIINMMGQCLELMQELCAICPADALHYLGEAAHLAMGAIRSCRVYILSMADKCSDETYRFVTRRENELSLEKFSKFYEAITVKVEENI